MPSSYTLGRHFEAFVKRQLESGRYNNASEVIRDALRLMEDRERLGALMAISPMGMEETGAGRAYVSGPVSASASEPDRRAKGGFKDAQGLLKGATNGRVLSPEDLNEAIADAAAKAGQG